MMDGDDDNPLENDLSVAQAITAMRVSGELKHTDFRILRALAENPAASSRQLAEATGMTHGAVLRRLRGKTFQKARSLLEGTVSEQMAQAAHSYARLVNKTLARVEEDPEELVSRLWEKHRADPEAFKRALALCQKAYDPQLAHEMGKAAVGFLAKEAELSLKSREVEVKERATPMAPAEAKAILEADIAGKPDIDVEIPEL